MDKWQNVHPGEIILEEFLRPMQIGQIRLANSIGVPPRRIAALRGARPLVYAFDMRRNREG